MKEPRIDPVAHQNMCEGGATLGMLVDIGFGFLFVPQATQARTPVRKFQEKVLVCCVCLCVCSSSSIVAIFPAAVVVKVFGEMERLEVPEVCNRRWNLVGLRYRLTQIKVFEAYKLPDGCWQVVFQKVCLMV